MAGTFVLTYFLRNLLNSYARTPILIKDRTGVVFIALGGRPSDPTWEQVHTRAASNIEAHRHLLDCLPKEKRHRRGIFTALARGFRYGNGMTVSQLIFFTCYPHDASCSATSKHQPQ